MWDAIKSRLGFGGAVDLPKDLADTAYKPNARGKRPYRHELMLKTLQDLKQGGMEDDSLRRISPVVSQILDQAATVQLHAKQQKKQAPSFQLLVQQEIQKRQGADQVTQTALAALGQVVAPAGGGAVGAGVQRSPLSVGYPPNDTSYRARLFDQVKASIPENEQPAVLPILKHVLEEANTKCQNDRSLVFHDVVREKAERWFDIRGNLSHKYAFNMLNQAMQSSNQAKRPPQHIDPSQPRAGAHEGAQQQQLAPSPPGASGGGAVGAPQWQPAVRPPGPSANRNNETAEIDRFLKGKLQTMNVDQNVREEVASHVDKIMEALNYLLSGADQMRSDHTAFVNGFYGSSGYVAGVFDDYLQGNVLSGPVRQALITLRDFYK